MALSAEVFSDDAQDNGQRYVRFRYFDANNDYLSSPRKIAAAEDALALANSLIPKEEAKLTRIERKVALHEQREGRTEPPPTQTTQDDLDEQFVKNVFNWMRDEETTPDKFYWLQNAFPRFDAMSNQRIVVLTGLSVPQVQSTRGNYQALNSAMNLIDHGLPEFEV